MDHDIVDDIRWCHNESPGEVQVIFRTARPPSGYGTGNAYLVVAKIVFFGVP